MMTNYITTRTFPADLTGRVGDLIPHWCRSAKMHHFNHVGLACVTAHRSEISAVRLAINLAKAEDRLAQSLRRNAAQRSAAQ